MMRRLRGRRVATLAVAMAFVLALSAAAAFAAIRVGTSGNDVLAGTPQADIFNGKEGDDTTTGKGGNDVYRYINGWGDDLVRDSAGFDLLDFSRVDESEVEAGLCPSQPDSSDVFPDDDLGFAQDQYGNTVDFAPNATAEAAVGGQLGGFLAGCGADNKLFAAPDNASDDLLQDIGGCTPAICGTGFDTPRRSNEIYGGFSGDFGDDEIIDTRGPSDAANLRSFDSGDDAFFFAVDFDGDSDNNSLLILLDDDVDNFGTLLIVGYLGPDSGEDTGDPQFATKVEQIRFADATLSPADVEDEILLASELSAENREAVESAAAAAEESRDSLEGLFSE